MGSVGARRKDGGLQDWSGHKDKGLTGCCISFSSLPACLVPSEQVNLFVTAIADGDMARDTPAKVQERLSQIVRKVRGSASMERDEGRERGWKGAREERANERAETISCAR